MTSRVCDLRRRLGTVFTVRFFHPSEILTMITKFSTWDTDKLQNYCDEVEANYLDAASDPRTTTEIVVGLREELIVLHDELSKRGV